MKRNLVLIVYNLQNVNINMSRHFESLSALCELIFIPVLLAIISCCFLRLFSTTTEFLTVADT